jgi:hypothetical protein
MNERKQSFSDVLDQLTPEMQSIYLSEFNFSFSNNDLYNKIHKVAISLLKIHASSEYTLVINQYFNKRTFK